MITVCRPLAAGWHEYVAFGWLGSEVVTSCLSAGESMNTEGVGCGMCNGEITL